MQRKPKRPLPQWVQDLRELHKHASEKQLRKIIDEMRLRAQREMERLGK